MRCRENYIRWREATTLREQPTAPDGPLGRVLEPAIRDIQEVRVRGRPYERPASIPVLDIPGGILAYGTADPLTDVTTQMHLFS